MEWGTTLENNVCNVSLKDNKSTDPCGLKEELIYFIV
jgi:hypothetical protein